MRKLLIGLLLTLSSFSVFAVSNGQNEVNSNIAINLNKKLLETHSHILENEFRLTLIEEKINELETYKIKKTLLRFAGKEAPSASWKVDTPSLQKLKDEYQANLRILKKKSTFLKKKLKLLKIQKIVAL